MKLRALCHGRVAALSPAGRHPAVEGGFDGAPIRHVLVRMA